MDWGSGPRPRLRDGQRRLCKWLTVRGPFFKVDADDFGDDIPPLFNGDEIANSDVFPGDLLLIVQRGARNGTAREKNRLELCNGGEDARPADLDGDIENAGMGLFGRELIGDGGAGGLARRAENVIGGQVVHFDDDPIDLKGKLGALFFNLFGKLHDLIEIGCHRDVLPLPRGKAPFF